MRSGECYIYKWWCCQSIQTFPVCKFNIFEECYEATVLWHFLATSYGRGVVNGTCGCHFVTII